MSEKKSVSLEVLQRNREATLINILNLFGSKVPYGKAEVRDYIKDGQWSGSHSHQTWANEHEIWISSQLFLSDNLPLLIDSIVHEAFHCGMADIYATLQAGGRITTAELDLLNERGSWLSGFMASRIVEKIDDIKNDFRKCGGSNDPKKSLEHIRDKWERKVLRPGLLFIFEDASNARHIPPSDIELYDQRFVFHVPAGQRCGMYLVMKDAKFSEERIEQSREYSIRQLENSIKSDTERLEFLKKCSVDHLMRDTWRLKT